jgi:hypothetical protein
MQALIRILITLAFIINTSNSHAKIGLGDWARKTPNDNEINNFYGNGLTLRLKNGKQVQELSRWYFYKENIVGQLHDGTYFVANENTGQVDSFQRIADFDHFIEAHKYEPTFWKRWHTADWAPLNDILFIALLAFPISIILVILFCIICYAAIIVEKLNYRRPFTLILISILLISLLNIALERFPQSI